MGDGGVGGLSGGVWVLRSVLRGLGGVGGG